MSDDFEKGLDHFGGPDGGDNLIKGWEGSPKEVRVFKTFQEAAEWSKKYGRTFTRREDGAFVPKLQKR